MAKKKPAAKKATTEIFQLRIDLAHAKPPIWRRVAVPSDITLADLHVLIQIVMGWDDCHMHQFTGPDETCYSDPDMELEEAEDESETRLNELLQAKGDTIQYEYDFGDDWEHILKLEKIAPPEEGVKYPICIEGKLACPPEDCGGIYGYYNMLEALADPKHESHDDMVDWIEEFDPKQFDLDKINRELATFR